MLAVTAAYGLPRGLAWIDLLLPESDPAYPTSPESSPGADATSRCRSHRDRRRSGEDRRVWLNHGAWPANWFPCAGRIPGAETFLDGKQPTTPLSR